MFKRRDVLQGIAGTSAVAVGVPTVVSAGTDPRAEPVGGDLPNENVDTADVYAFPEEPDPIEVETGEWIDLSNGWITEEEHGECELQNLLNNTTQTFIIDGETFVLESVDDWEFDDDPDDDDLRCEAAFRHSVPPKPPETRYSIRWEFEADDEAYEDEFPNFPLENEVEVVTRSGQSD